jgi:hypothetical protein
MKSTFHPAGIPAILLLSPACSLFSSPSPSSESEIPPMAKSPDLPPPVSITEENAPPGESDWPTYLNDDYWFALQYPPDAELAEAYDVFARINLHREGGTTLFEKYLDVNVFTGLEQCESTLPPVVPSSEELRNIGGEDWRIQETDSASAGPAMGATSYATSSGEICVVLDFVLLVADASKYDPTPRPFNRDTETGIFDPIVETFEWAG